MSIKRMTTWQKATALVPLALLSGAWTASLAVTTATAADSDDPQQLPDGTTMPTEVIEEPANIAVPGKIAPGVPKGSEKEVLKNVSTNGIPAAALAAYQRAAQVIGTADASCKIEWPLVAAIGRVESDHGRYGGNVLNAEGVSQPGIYGIPLDGSNGTQRISDTDAGQYDNDKTFDRAVGPMQFIPSTWSVVGVDGDGDGKRNPQDIDDAALATAVYLCSGDEDLSTRAGQEAAVFRYNHSDDYVSLVLSIMESYASGDYSAVPTSSSGTTTFTPSYGDSVFSGGTQGYTPPKSSGPGNVQNDGTSGTGSTSDTGSTDDTGSTGDTEYVPPTGNDDDNQDPQPEEEPPPAPVEEPSPSTDPGKEVQDTVKDTEETVEDTVKDTEETVEDTVTEAEAKEQCLAQGISALDVAKLEACIADLVG